MRVPSPPDGSRIQVEETLQGTQFAWKNPDSPLGRLGTGGFLFFWLGGWTIGGIFALSQLLRSIIEGSPVSLFLLFWLGGWALGEIFAARTLFQMMRGPGFATLVLGPRNIEYQPGNTLYFMTARNQADTRAVSAEKHEITNLQLTYVNEHLRLSFDVGVRRVEIGPSLSEPEKEWLHQILEDWLRF